MTTYTTKTLAAAMVQAHAASPFADRDAAILWAYGRGNGATLNMADKAYGMAGLKLGGGAPVSRKEEALEWLASEYGTRWDADAVRTAIRAIVARFEVKEGTARDYTKAYSEELEVEHPTTASTTDSDEVIAWVVEHYDDHADYESLKNALIEEFTARGRSRSNINEYTKGLRMHFAILNR